MLQNVLFKTGVEFLDSTVKSLKRHVKNKVPQPLPLSDYGLSLVDVSGQVPAWCAHSIQNKN